jgi:hypothetical protein
MKTQTEKTLEEHEERLVAMEMALSRMDVGQNDRARVRGSNWELSENILAQWDKGAPRPLAGETSQYLSMKEGALLINGERAFSTGFKYPNRYWECRDAVTHPLSSLYDNLLQAQADFPCAVAMTDELAWCAIQTACSNAVAGDEVFIPKGIYLVNKPITCAHSINFVMEGTISYTGAHTAPCITIGTVGTDTKRCLFKFGLD